MATEPLDSVISNVPDWLRRLEELNGQIEQRQQELAKFAAGRPLSSAQSLRNRGSTESLRPRNEEPAVPEVAEPTTDQALQITTDQPPQTPVAAPETSKETQKEIQPSNPIQTPTTEQPQQTTITVPPQTPNGNQNGNQRPNPVQSPTGSDPWSEASLVRHTNELVATAQRRARATVHKRQKTDSMLSAEGQTPKYRSRRMVMVYYDSYVQSFFEELVKFVSAQRNLIRRAKMAAKVAYIRQLAELEIPDGDEDATADNAADASPAVASSSNPRPYSPAIMPRRGLGAGSLSERLGNFNEKSDIWDEMDKGLEFVQGMCERAAHQFLRDGDCAEEVEKIRNRLVKVKEAAVNEKERLAAEKPAENPTEDKEKAKAVEPAGPTALTPAPVITAASDPSQEPTPKPAAQSGDDAAPDTENPVIAPRVRPEDANKSRVYRPSTMRRGVSSTSPKQNHTALGVLEIDEGIEVDVDDFKPVYRSTRQMRR